MAKPSDIITVVSGLMNDSAQAVYTNTVCLPFLNLALDELQEIFEINGIPITNNTTSTPLTIPVGTPGTAQLINYTTTPSLPTDLIEIQQLWESVTGLNKWTPMIKKEFIPQYLFDNTTISMFLIWAWEHGSVQLIPVNQINDIKIDYTANMFNTPILIANIGVDLPFTNIKTYLEYKTAALCAMFQAENPERAGALDSLAGTALSRALGIPIKGMQSIITRRKPFRQSFKRRGVSY